MIKIMEKLAALPVEPDLESFRDEAGNLNEIAFLDRLIERKDVLLEIACEALEELSKFPNTPITHAEVQAVLTACGSRKSD